MKSTASLPALSSIRHRSRSVVAHFGCLLALLTTQATAQVQINYTDGQTNTSGYNTSAPNSPTTLNLSSGTATQSGVITGSGLVNKTGAGTLILSGANNYTGNTTINAGTLQVVAGGSSSGSFATSVAKNAGDVATLSITGGSVSGGRFTLVGDGAGSSGTVNVSSGTWTQSQIIVGNGGTGRVNISGGSVSTQVLTVSNAADGSTLNLSGGTLTASSYLEIGPSGNIGTVNVSGGTLSSGGIDAEGNSVMNLTGGSVTNFGDVVSNDGSGLTFNVSGGTWTNTGDFAPQGGVLNLSGGSISSANGFLWGTRRCLKTLNCPRGVFVA